MTIPTEPIGSIPRPLKLLDAINRHGSSHPSLEPLYDDAVRDTIEQFEATGSPVVTDGEQRKYHNFATYCVEGLPNTAPDGFKLPFSAGHTRRLPQLTGGPFRFLAANFYIALAGEPDRTSVLKIIRQYLKPGHRIFIGVVSPIDPRIENPKEIRDRILEGTRYIPAEQLGTTDDCGFSPFCDDTSTTLETAFAKIRSRVEETALAEEIINGR
jgi:methionine synthase II (cobalamin-independent)